jgi:hypothetical protein
MGCNKIHKIVFIEVVDAPRDIVQPMTFTTTMLVKKFIQYTIFMIMLNIIKELIYFYLNFVFNIAHKILYKNR